MHLLELKEWLNIRKNLTNEEYNTTTKAITKAFIKMPTTHLESPGYPTLNRLLMRIPADGKNFYANRFLMQTTRAYCIYKSKELLYLLQDKNNC